MGGSEVNMTDGDHFRRWRTVWGQEYVKMRSEYAQTVLEVLDALHLKYNQLVLPSVMVSFSTSAIQIHTIHSRNVYHFVSEMIYLDY
jgi:hypothetical protein